MRAAPFRSSGGPRAAAAGLLLVLLASFLALPPTLPMVLAIEPDIHDDSGGSAAPPTPTPTITPTPTLTPTRAPTPTVTPQPGAVAPSDKSNGLAAPYMGPVFKPITPTAIPSNRIAAAAVIRARDAAGNSLHVMPHVGLILGAANVVGVEPAVIAALMEVEGSGTDAVSPAGAAGLMQLMPDKYGTNDDPFDPATNILRAAQYIGRLVAIYGYDLASVSAAYFGAIDAQGNVTDATDGFTTGPEYVAMFADAYQRWARYFGQPGRPIAIPPVVKQRQPGAARTAASWRRNLDGPERDQWYLYMERPEPVRDPLFSSSHAATPG